MTSTQLHPLLQSYQDPLTSILSDILHRLQNIENVQISHTAYIDQQKSTADTIQRNLSLLQHNADKFKEYDQQLTPLQSQYKHSEQRITSAEHKITDLTEKLQQYNTAQNANIHTIKDELQQLNTEFQARRTHVDTQHQQLHTLTSDHTQQLQKLTELHHHTNQITNHLQELNIADQINEFTNNLQAALGTLNQHVDNPTVHTNSTDIQSALNQLNDRFTTAEQNQNKNLKAEIRKFERDLMSYLNDKLNLNGYTADGNAAATKQQFSRCLTCDKPSQQVGAHSFKFAVDNNQHVISYDKAETAQVLALSNGSTTYLHGIDNKVYAGAEQPVVEVLNNIMPQRTARPSSSTTSRPSSALIRPHTQSHEQTGMIYGNKQNLYYPEKVAAELHHSRPSSAVPIDANSGKNYTVYRGADHSENIEPTHPLLYSASSINVLNSGVNKRTNLPARPMTAKNRPSSSIKR